MCIRDSYYRIRYVYLSISNPAVFTVRTSFFMKGTIRLTTPFNMAPISGKVLPSNDYTATRLPLGIVISENAYAFSVVESNVSGAFSTTVVGDISRDMGFLICLLYTSDAADEEDSVDLGGCRHL
eukprot:TRINITY_DN24275_c0_g1_i1.p1 TRINITY_DN24275_c0_g1~~TRINITY_DN24275_c0_g1_i1.p1  ORF type:complete len:125 (+),score=2.20 TRINITY_DN24275_c0_g1_i1:91-465(+)